MSAYQSLYRKYRSQTFDEIVGQDPIVKTLINAIEHDRLTHAYIFSGPRGTGKTSTARILAKALNCQSGPTAKPCLSCSLCQKIGAHTAIDVIEIDAASHTGVDNIRALNDQVQFSSVECRTKLYIIDEAHMLSIGAFNALLKTLEEPPPNTVFTLATTEPQKIPVTIHSRCQRLHFRHIGLQDMVGRLAFVAQQEGLVIDDACLRVIGKNAAGCLRDALSLLEQVYAYKGPQIDMQDLLLVMGTANHDRLYLLLNAMAQNQLDSVLTELNELLEEGLNVFQLVGDLTRLLQQALFAKLNLPLEFPEIREALAPVIDSLSFSQLAQWVESFARLETDLKGASNPHLIVQVRLLTAMKSLFEITTPVTKISAPPVPIPSSPPTPPPKSSLGFDPAKWKDVLAIIKTQKPSLYVVLAEASLVLITPGLLKLSLKQNFRFFTEKLSEASTKAFLEAAMTTAFGSPYKYTLDETTSVEVATTSQTEGKPALSVDSAKTLNDILALFDGTLVA